MEQDLVFAAQSAALRPWVATLTPGELAQPSALDGWVVADLISHLVRTLDSVAVLQPATDGHTPLSIGEYLASYRADAAGIAQMTRDLTAGSRRGLLPDWDDAARRAEQTLAALGPGARVVLARRGPILLTDFLDTRLVELVVHADDLHRSLPARPAPPVLPSARRQVLTVLREVLTERSAYPAAAIAAASALEPAMFIDLAAGRIAPPAGLAPELTAALPLL